MPVELLCLLFLAFFAASLWIPFIVGVNTMPTPVDAPSPFVVPPDPLKMPPWIARSFRAHQNLLEQLLPFALVILIADLQGISTPVTRMTAIVFVGLRLIHAVGMITAWARMPLRPLVFTAGYIAIVVLVVEIVRVGW